MRYEGIGKPPGCKLLRFTADIEEGILRSIHIRGDFFAIPEEGFEQVERLLPGTPLPELAAVFDALLDAEGIEVFGISGKALADLMRSSIDGAGGL